MWRALLHACGRRIQSDTAKTRPREQQLESALSSAKEFMHTLHETHAASERNKDRIADWEYIDHDICGRGTFVAETAGSEVPRYRASINEIGGNMLLSDHRLHVADDFEQVEFGRLRADS
jgi:hypothetical protein